MIPTGPEFALSEKAGRGERFAARLPITFPPKRPHFASKQVNLAAIKFNGHACPLTAIFRSFAILTVTGVR